MSSNRLPPPIWLLLLPHAPSDISLNALKVAYGPGLTQALKIASEASARTCNVVLDIAVACEDGLDFQYSEVQRLLGLLYTLICVICTERSIGLQNDNDVDVRLVFFHSIHSQNTKTGPENQIHHNHFIDLQDLARSRRPWQRLYSLESENAESLLQDFLRIRDESYQPGTYKIPVNRLPGGLTINSRLQNSVKASIGSSKRHTSVAVGGTFDHLHAGHKLLLTMTALVLDPQPAKERYLTVGITSDELLKKKKYRENLEDIKQRQIAVQNFLLDILGLISLDHVLQSSRDIPGLGSHGITVYNQLKSGLIIKYVEISDPCGPTISDESITALVLSAETRGGGQVVNEKREEKGWPALDVFEVDVLDIGESEGNESSQADSKFQCKISSTDIRRGLHEKAQETNDSIRTA